MFGGGGFWDADFWDLGGFSLIFVIIFLPSLEPALFARGNHEGTKGTKGFIYFLVPMVSVGTALPRCAGCLGTEVRGLDAERTGAASHAERGRQGGNGGALLGGGRLGRRWWRLLRFARNDLFQRVLACGNAFGCPSSPGRASLQLFCSGW